MFNIFYKIFKKQKLFRSRVDIDDSDSQKTNTVKVVSINIDG